MRTLLIGVTVAALSLGLTACELEDDAKDVAPVAEKSVQSVEEPAEAPEPVDLETPTEAPTPTETAAPAGPAEAEAGFIFAASDYARPRIATALHEAGFDAFLSRATDPVDWMSEACAEIDGEVKGSSVPRAYRRDTVGYLTNWPEGRAQKFVDALYAACYDTGVAVAKIPMTLAQENAIGKARDYLDYSGFSHSGLIGQLEYEGFSTSDATFAVDHSGANWMDEAAEKARDYMDYSSFSRQGLIDQLLYEGFTSEQAAHGASKVGY